jgi:hypothetical protein
MRRKTFSLASLTLLVAVVGAYAEYGDGARGRIGIGYDEGLAGRFFFTERMGAQLSIGFEQIGESDNTSETETDVSFAGAFLYNLLATQYVYLDAMAQLAMVADDAADNPPGVNDRTDIYLRVAAAPEILIAGHLGLGFRFGFETAIIGDVEENQAGAAADLDDDGHTDIRFFGPRNPFPASGLLGVSLYVYF